MLRRFFAAPIDNYIDDDTIVEPDCSACPRSCLASPRPGRLYPRSAQASLWDFSEELSMANWSPEKSSAWSQVIDSIGMMIDFSSLHIDGIVKASIKPSIFAKVHNDMVACLISGQINPKLASEIGKFRWVACLSRENWNRSYPTSH